MGTSPGEQPAEYSQPGSAPRTSAAQGPAIPADDSAMRIVLEWLGLVTPDRSRREPIAVPSWAPYAVAGVVTFAAAVLVAVVSVALRLLLG